jgi:RNA-binding protein YhbY
VPGNGVNYKGLFFDTLKDEATDAALTLVVPGLIRSKLAPNKVIECTAYVVKKVLANAGRIDLQLNIIEVVSQSQSSFNEDQVKAFEILQKKAELGHKDADSFIKEKIIKGDRVKIIVLIGKGGIIDQDIKHQIKEALAFYELYFIKINLSSETEIIESLINYSQKSPIVVISRGGGDNLEIFDSPVIAEASLHLPSFFITAIGHQQDTPLLQKVADKSFITPTAFGQLEVLQQQLKHERDEKFSIKQRVQELEGKVPSQSKVPIYVWVLIIVLAFVIGWQMSKL